MVYVTPNETYRDRRAVGVGVFSGHSCELARHALAFLDDSLGKLPRPVLSAGDSERSDSGHYMVRRVSYGPFSPGLRRES